MKSAAEMLVDTIEATGGVFPFALRYAPVGDPDWIDIGWAYIKACDELGREPFISEEL